jgi:hypothetical protein
VKSARRDETTDPGKLLGLWMNDVHLDPDQPRRSRGLAVVTTVAIVLVGVILAKYAADVLLLLAGLAVAVLVIRELMVALARSDLLSFSSLVVIGMLAGLGAWLFLPHPERAGLVLPEPVARLLDSSQKHGWGYTAFSQRPVSEPGTGFPTPASAEPARQATSDVSPAVPATAPPVVTLSSSQPSTAPGQPVVFTARLGDSTQAGGEASVRFYDGSTFLGTGVVRQEGRVRVAYLTVTTLAVGTHAITAEIVRSRRATGERSPVLLHMVVAPTGQ